eukprot:TRINITY_DN16628_c0_g1_i1.p1 TRINITY_DN16628_c0_g1~~TRINITY_DN16628_c0_g1_i1.p1  ORF type:complete len:260 (+),score=52.38 TRINITY_DN16628_c0_g1_i1:40-819(+)
MDSALVWGAALLLLIVIDVVGVVYMIRLIRRRRLLQETKEIRTPEVVPEERELSGGVVAPPYPLASPQLREQQERALREAVCKPLRPTQQAFDDGIPSLTVTPVKSSNKQQELCPPDLSGLIVPPPTKTPSPSRQTRRVRVVSPHCAISPSTAPNSSPSDVVEAEPHNVSEVSDGLNDSSWWCSPSQSEEARGVLSFDEVGDTAAPIAPRQVGVRLPNPLLSTSLPPIREPRMASTSADSQQSFPGGSSTFRLPLTGKI